MKRILLFSTRDWLSPEAGGVEHYIHEVVMRLARWGNSVALVSHDFAALPWTRRRRPNVEVVDGVQIGRLGMRCLYRGMAKILIERLARSGKLANQFDVIIDCITTRPLRLHTATSIPVIPLVFNLNTDTALFPGLPGPVIAVTRKAREDIKRTGLLESYIVQAPFAVENNLPSTGAGAVANASPLVVAHGVKHRLLNAAIKTLKATGLSVDLAWADSIAEDTSPTPLYQRAWVGVCGLGEEWRALTMGACGIPVVCADTPIAREFVEDGVTGLLYPAGNRRALTDVLARLLQDEVLRKRLSMASCEQLDRRTWDRTAGLVLATIENLSIGES